MTGSNENYVLSELGTDTLGWPDTSNTGQYLLHQESRSDSTESVNRATPRYQINPLKHANTDEAMKLRSNYERYKSAVVRVHTHIIYKGINNSGLEITWFASLFTAENQQVEKKINI